MAAVALVIGLSQVSTDSAAVKCPPGSKPVGVGCIDKHPVHIAEYCLTARRGAAFYRARTWRLQRERGAELAGRTPIVRGKSCHWARYATRVWHARSKAALKALERWRYQYDWRSWLPAKWQRIAICETGLNWQHSNSSYEGAFGFAKSSWDSFKGRADRRAGPYPEDAWQATPRQQYEVALAIWREYGLSGWGCRAA